MLCVYSCLVFHEFQGQGTRNPVVCLVRVGVEAGFMKPPRRTRAVGDRKELRVPNSVGEALEGRGNPDVAGNKLQKIDAEDPYQLGGKLSSPLVSMTVVTAHAKFSCVGPD